MGETLLLITITTLIILTIRRARPVVLDNPLVIERSGQYHLTFAPQLNQAQRFVEAVASRFRELAEPAGDLAAQYFKVCDPKVKPRDADYYLLAIAQRDGMLYIQTIGPQGADDLATLREFSDKVLAAHPLCDSGDGAAAVCLTDAVDAQAVSFGIVVSRLQVAD